MGGSKPQPAPAPPAPPPPPPVLEQAAPEKAAAPTQSDTLNRQSAGSKRYRSSLGIADGAAQTASTGLGIAT